MKTLLITSAVTFVPRNYDEFIAPMAENSHIAGLIIIDNRSWDIVFKACALILSAAAPRMGFHLLKNQFDSSIKRKQAYFSAQGKQVWVVRDINSSESLALLKSIDPDLLLNARTRSFFKKNLLSIPKYGCVNIHHGLLPHQRGLMCDFWSHLYNLPSGFSIHQMTEKLDDGVLLKVVEVPSDKQNYFSTIQKGAAMEASAAQQVLSQIATDKKIQGIENLKTENTVYRRNPGLKDFYNLRLKGVKI
ncbi:MAG: formyltransferase family protein [Bdellovibrio sp.]